MSLFRKKAEPVAIIPAADGMSVKSAIETRRSTRKYLDKAVPKELIEEVIDAGRMAPSGGNSQTTRFIVITKRDVLEDLNKIVKDEFSKMSVKPGMYLPRVNAIMQSKAGTFRYDYHTPVLIVLCNKKDYGNAMADSSCAAMNMLLRANEMDMGACWINQLHWLTDTDQLTKYMKKLGLEDDETITASVAFGYPDTKDGLPNRIPSRRKGNPVNWVE